MSLRSLFNQHGTVIGQYLWQRYPHTGKLVRAANAQLAGAVTVRPDLPNYPWAVVARATALRLRYSLGFTSPRQLLAWHGAQLLTQAPEAPYPLAALPAIFAELEAILRQCDAAGRPPLPAEEAICSSVCYVLGLCEDLARTGRLDTTPLLDPTAPRTGAGLLALTPQAVVVDITGMAARFVTAQADLLAQPHILFPAFGAEPSSGAALDPVIICDTLYLVKVTTQPTVEGRWLRELVGYGLWDAEDRYRLRHVGIIAPRQGTVLRWPLAEIATRLAGESCATLTELRHEFAVMRRAARGVPVPITTPHWGETASRAAGLVTAEGMAS